MAFAFEIVSTVRREMPQLFDAQMERDVVAMLEEAVEVESAFAQDLLNQGVPGLSVRDMRQYLEYTADQRLMNLGMPKRFNVRNPLAFMDLQDVQELANFFERRVSAYQVAIKSTASEIRFDESF
jgi:ribonucleoside-diphosphate reductase beta chain